MTAVSHVNTPGGYMSRVCPDPNDLTFHLSHSPDYTPATCEYWRL